MRFIATQGGPLDSAGHSAPITSVEWSPTGEYIATGSYDGLAIVWDRQLQVVRRFRHSRLVNGVRWSPDGELLAVACADGHCHVWEFRTGTSAAVLSRHTDDVNSVAWSSNGGRIATVSEDCTGRIWSITEQELLDIILVHTDHCMSVDWNPAKALVATCGEDAVIKLWDEEGALVAEWPQPGSLEMVRWNPKGDRLACACDDRTVRILDLDGKEVSVIGPHNGAVKSVSWSPDGSLIATGSYDLSASVWRVDGSESVWRYYEGRMWPRSISWSPTGQEIAVGSQDGSPFLFDALQPPRNTSLGGRRLQPIERPTYGVNSIAAVGNSWLCGLDDGTLRLWSPNDNINRLVTSEALARPASLINAVSYNDSLKVAAFGRFSGGVALVSLDGAVYDSADVGAPVNAVAWNSTLHVLAVADYEGKVTIFSCDVPALRLKNQRSFTVHSGAIKDLAWLDTDHLVTGATDRTLRVISKDGEVLRTMYGHGNLINAVAVSSGSNRPLVASVSRDRTVRIWNPSTGKCERVLIGHTESVKSVSWKPDSSCELVTGSYDFDARIWNLSVEPEAKEYCRRLAFHRQGIGSVVWTPTVIATASWDAAVAIWNPISSQKDDTITPLSWCAFRD